MPDIRPLGTSGLSTIPLMLGGNVFGWTADEAASFAVLDAFMAGGGTLIDTADIYSAWIDGNRGGESEEMIGRWLRARGRRDDVLIATKVGMLDGVGGTGLQPARIAAAVAPNRRASARLVLSASNQPTPISVGTTASAAMNCAS